VQLVPTILSGGAGSRLWPVSRQLHPKPFIRLADGQSLLQKAFLRGVALPDVQEILVNTNEELYLKTLSDFKEVNTKKAPVSFILEPFGRNTAAAVVLSSLYALKAYGKDVVLLVLPADHLITEQDAFAKAVEDAVKLAGKGRIVTFGVTPDRPETGYGYIQANGNDVVRFVEKPSLEKAQQFLAQGNYLWNAGMFCFSAQTMLDAFKKYAPDILELATACLEASAGKKQSGVSSTSLSAEKFSELPDISIDYAILEKSENVAVVPCTMGWQDIGSWTALSELVPHDEDNNSIHGKAVFHDVSNCHVQSDERVIAAVGVSDLLIIDTPDALLVANKACAQDVKSIFSQLKAEKHETCILHRTVYRPWGTYTTLEEGPGFKIKRIEVNPLSSLSLQMHHHRSEHWVVVSGTANVVNGDKGILLRTNESTFIPVGVRHRLENPGKIPLVLIEVQSGEYLGEDDIVRYEDDYGRQ